MRWLFLLLLAANILLFSWIWLADGADGGARQAAELRAGAQGGRQLVLLSELESHAAAERQEPVAEEPAPPRAAEPEPPSPTESAAAAPVAARKTPSPAPAARPERSPAAGGGKRCYVLGPFASANEVQRVVQRSGSTAAVVERRWSNPRQRPGYWVHIPPAASAGEARAALRRLTSLEGSGDIQLITSGEMRHAISLGIFSTMENARKRVREVQQYGFNVAVNEVQIRKRQYWLALRGSRGRGLSDRVIGDLLEGFTGVGVERRSCSRLY